MKRYRHIVYWISTIWLTMGMTATGFFQLIRRKEEVEMFQNLGYPGYLLTIIGIWKLLAVVSILVPRSPLLKEWAYAGFFFVMTGAVFSHIASGNEAGELFGPVLLLVLTLLSWYTRPAEKRIQLGNS